MPTKKRPSKKTTKKTIKKADKTAWQQFRPWLVKRVNTVRNRVTGLMNRRPHRSFRVTRKRDYKRSFKLPGYWSFTNHVRSVLWTNRKLFGALSVVYLFAIVIIGGFGAQDTYSNLATLLRESSGDLFAGNYGAVSEAGLLLVASITTGLAPSLTEGQSVILGLTFFYVFLTIVWLLRNVLAGHKPRLRDGLYNCGSPVVATVAIAFIMVVQLLPLSVGLIAYDAAVASGLADSGAPAVLALSGVVALGLVSLYWIVASLVAIIISTLPGMYPFRAIRAAGDMVVGRRFRILLRLSWLAFIVVLTWAVIVIPIIMFDSWLKDVSPNIGWLPLVPLVIFAMSSVTVVFATTYIYLLYRRLVDDDAAPA